MSILTIKSNWITPFTITKAVMWYTLTSKNFRKLLGFLENFFDFHLLMIYVIFLQMLYYTGSIIYILTHRHTATWISFIRIMNKIIDIYCRRHGNIWNIINLIFIIYLLIIKILVFFILFTNYFYLLTTLLNIIINIFINFL
jgi:hypothetical protein